MLEREKVQGRVLEQLEVHVASVQETAMQHRAHQPGRERTGGRWGRLSTVSSRTTGGGHCQVQSKPNGVILPNHWSPLPRMLCTAKSDMVSKSYQRNWRKKTTLRMTDYKDNDSREDLLC